MGEASNFLQYGALGIVFFLVVAAVIGASKCASALWAYWTDPEGPIERFIGANTEFVKRQGEFNERVASVHANQTANIEQLKRAGRHFVCAAIDVANKLQLSEETKRALRHAEEELNS